MSVFFAPTSASSPLRLDRSRSRRTGAIGGSHTHEFMVLAEVGEDRIVHRPQCGYAANVEKAVAVPTPWPVTASGAKLRQWRRRASGRSTNLRPSWAFRRIE